MTEPTLFRKVFCGDRLLEKGIEIWKPVIGWEKLYEVSNEGRVRSMDRITTHKGGMGTHYYKGRFLKLSIWML